MSSLPPSDNALHAARDLAPYPSEFAQVEQALLDRAGRRARAGLALSGGGIRSATFALGLAQGLARIAAPVDSKAKPGLLRHFDFLSTVSGGGYFGSFFGHLLQRTHDPDISRANPATSSLSTPEQPPPPPPPRPELVDELLADPHAPAVEYLRANGRYLAPNGAGDLLAAAAAVLRNWASSLVVVGSVVLLAAALLALVRYGIFERVEWFDTFRRALPFWLSPWVGLIGVVLIAGTVPLAWSYWLIRDGSPGDTRRYTVERWIGLVAAFGIAAGMLAWPLMAPVDNTRFTGLLTALAIVTVAVCGLTVLWHFVLGGASESPHIARRHRSTVLARSLLVLLVLALITLLDSTALIIFTQLGSKATLSAGVAALIAWTARSPLISLANKLKDKSLGPVPASTAVVAVVLIVLGYFGGIAAIPHIVQVAYGIDDTDAGVSALGLLAAVLLLVVSATSDLWYFLNRSSMHALYEARLRRAYLGASNPARTGEGTTRLTVTEPHAMDGMKRSQYDPSRAGGPLHLINVCVNETIDGRSQLQQRDRKGMGMALGAAGVSVGVRHHALWTNDEHRRANAEVTTSEYRAALVSQSRHAPLSASAEAPPSAKQEFRVFPLETCIPEDLEIGAWVAISGGAVSTGLGSRTNAAFSLLLGLFNVRMGYWWNSGVSIGSREGQSARTKTQQSMTYLRSFIRMQSALLDEWFARFPGTARPDWYLTDGGHFENLGGYELIRRKLPLIVISDAEADEGYQFGGLANLVRKARTDFGAEIEFLDQQRLDALSTAAAKLPDCVGPLESLKRRDAKDISQAHAALAQIVYADGTRGWLVYLKPTLDGDEPTDVLEYHDTHVQFPHESTGDQFFDEAQWESYRRLGEHVATQVFGGESVLAAQLRGEQPLGR